LEARYALAQDQLMFMEIMASANENELNEAWKEHLSAKAMFDEM